MTRCAVPQDCVDMMCTYFFLHFFGAVQRVYSDMVRDMIHSWMRRDASICVTWLFHVWDSDVMHCVTWRICETLWCDAVWDSDVMHCVTWIIRMWDMTYSWMGFDSFVSHDLFVCVTWHIRMCHMTQSSVWQDSSPCYTWFIHMCDRTHLCMWHDSFTYVTGLIHKRAEWLMTHQKTRAHEVDHTKVFQRLVLHGVAW